MSNDISKWLEYVPRPSPRASIITAPTPPPSPAMTVAFPNHQDFSNRPSTVANRCERLVYTTGEDDDSHDDNTSILPHPSPRQVSGLFVGVGQAQSTPARLVASRRQFRRTGLAPLGILADLSNITSMVSNVDEVVPHAESDDSSMRVDSGMGEKAVDAEGRETSDNGIERPVSFVSRVAERLEEFAREELERMR
jgi:hypothetical protein